MAFSASGNNKSGGENISHWTAVRLRINGNGVIRMTLSSLDGNITQTLATINMNAAPGREPRVLCNFSQQRAFLRMETTDIGETMKVNRIIMFGRQLWTDYPDGGS